MGTLEKQHHSSNVPDNEHIKRAHSRAGKHPGTILRTTYPAAHFRRSETFLEGKMFILAILAIRLVLVVIYLIGVADGIQRSK